MGKVKRVVGVLRKGLKVVMMGGKSRGWKKGRRGVGMRGLRRGG